MVRGLAPIIFLLPLACGSSGGVPATPGTNDEVVTPADLGPLTPEEAWELRRTGVAKRGGPADGLPEVRQPGSRLVWLRCPLGQRWRNGSCLGEPAAFHEMAVEGACPRGYRLPSIEEMLLLLGKCDRRAGRLESGLCRICRDSPSCGSMFGDDRGWYWSTPAFMPHGAEQGTWSVSFEHGYVHFVPLGESKKAMIRCVREGAR